MGYDGAMKLSRDTHRIGDFERDTARQKEQQETVAGVRRGIADMKAGRVKDVDEVFRDIEKRFGINLPD